MNIKNCELYKKIINRENIYTAICSIESYIFEKNLLSKEDIECFEKLSDKYDFEYIEQIISFCEKKLLKILNEKDELFEITVYFKPKKYDEEKQQLIYRPLHTTDIITQICLVCMLNVIMFEDTKNGRKLSDIAKTIPSNFFGNIPNVNIETLFYPWKVKYKEYTENVIKAYQEYRETNHYKYEITLDLKQFFPSVNPAIIYSLIIEKYSTIYEGVELECLKSTLIKMLYFKISGIKDCYQYYYTDFIAAKVASQEFYSLGIPQGLPQAYFFGNLCMIEIAKIINSKFPGDSYYYVDDSVIYTNDGVDNFAKSLEEINSKLSLLGKNIQEQPDLPKSIKIFETDIFYEIKVHTEGKSTYTEISNGKMGLNDLIIAALPASNIPFEISSTIDDVEDSSVKDKIDKILLAIKKEIEYIKEENSGEDQNIYGTYLKLLIRYQKFYLFKQKIMELRNDNSVEKFSESYYQKYAFVKDIKNLDKKKLFENLDEDIFLAETQLLLTYLSSNNREQKSLIERVELLENDLSSNKINNKYFTTVLKGSRYFENDRDWRYISLSRIARKKIGTVYKVHNDKRSKELADIIKNIQTDDKYILSYFDINKEYILFAYQASNYKRNLLNALFSVFFNIQINDGCNFLKTDNRSILYYELRILTYLRNRLFDLDEFVVFSKKIIEDFKNKNAGYEKIDFSLLEILLIFKQYVQHPKRVDDLILIHKYITGLWRNGSKFLYFYTLHNEEHSVELIKSSVRLTKSIDYFKLKENDFFILFAACYLHDISMVLYPNLNKFSEDKVDSNIIYTEWKDEIRNSFRDAEYSEKSLAKKFILKYFELLNTYFETEIRDRHPKQSASFVKNRSNKELDFITDEIRNIIANISEAHGYYCKDVYGLKSVAKDHAFSEKYLMILLRFADLLDMAKDRVSINILKQNIKFMPEISKFHWISHMAIDRCEIRTEYDYKVLKKDNRYLYKQCIDEIIIIDIYLNTRQLTKVTSPFSACNNRRCTLDQEKKVINIDICEDICNTDCNFLCKWMQYKNEYLYNELYELQKYLSRNENNLFLTKTKVILHYNNSNTIPAEFVDIVNNKINS